MRVHPEPAQARRDRESERDAAERDKRVDLPVSDGVLMLARLLEPAPGSRLRPAVLRRRPRRLSGSAGNPGENRREMARSGSNSRELATRAPRRIQTERSEAGRVVGRGGRCQDLLPRLVPVQAGSRRRDERKIGDHHGKSCCQREKLAGFMVNVQLRRALSGTVGYRVNHMLTVIPAHGSVVLDTAVGPAASCSKPARSHLC